MQHAAYLRFDLYETTMHTQDSRVPPYYVRVAVGDAELAKIPILARLKNEDLVNGDYVIAQALKPFVERLFAPTGDGAHALWPGEPLLNARQRSITITKQQVEIIRDSIGAGSFALSDVADALGKAGLEVEDLD